jgi:predicted KAP-like P-loop ATPase
MTLLIIPLVINFEPIKLFLSNPSPKHILSIIISVIVILLLTFNLNVQFVKKYINNFSLSIPSFVVVDYIFWILLSMLFLSIILFTEYFVGFSDKIWMYSLILIQIVIVYYLFSFVSILNPKFARKKENEIVDELSDNPINTMEDDLLGREDFVKLFAKEIKSFEIFGGQSYVFGLHGKWGEGKTSVINLVKNEIKDNDDFIIINFNPWQYKDEQAIIAAFFYEIEKTFTDHYLLNDIKGYLQKYIKLVSFGFVQLEFKIDIFTESQSFHKTKTKIQNYINRLDKRIVVVIDDIDRLNFSEMQLIFKLVSLIAKFDNFIFILLFDYTLVEKYLADNQIEKEYVEKIIQKSFKLPLPEKSKISKYLYDGIKKIFQDNKFRKEDIDVFFKTFDYQYNIKLQECFITLRNVKTFLKLLKFELPLVAHEVNLHDFCLLLILKVFYLKIFEDIIQNPRVYINIPITEKVSITGIFDVMDKDKDEKIKKHIDELIQAERNPLLVLQLLSNLFPLIAKIYNSFGVDKYRIDRTERYEKRISDYELFDKYFTLSVSTKIMSDKYLEEIIENWNKVDE